MTRIPHVVASAFLMSLLPGLTLSPAAAQTASCGSRAEILSHLAGRYAEQPVARGRTSDGSVVEILASHDGSSFTVIRTFPDGVSCLIAAGSDWATIRRRLEDLGA